ncbi:MAG TPA: hypothetical protein VMB81_06425 [Candidatus Sulfotelmatobacter sp.]|nr:hypothetical protein [Candidatus Sulfotelmatobacter sp.]
MVKPHGIAQRKGGPEDQDSAGIGRATRGRPVKTVSLRRRLEEFFNSGCNASDRELAAMLGTSAGAISVYRCQLKKIGVGVPSPNGARRNSTANAEGPEASRPAATRPAVAKRGPRSTLVSSDVVSPPGAAGLSLSEISQVLAQNVDSELDLLIERHPEVARAVANIKQTIGLLLRLRRR